MRIFAIPDIHGRRDLLESLLETLKTKHSVDLTKDKLIFLGDMVDRGSDSKGVMDIIQTLLINYPSHVVALAGNHEWLMIDGCIKGNHEFELWIMNGGGTTLSSFPGGKVPEEYLKWAAQLPLFHEEPGFFFSHAPIPRHLQRSKDSPPFSKHALTWTYEDGDENKWSKNFGKGIVGVCGHIHRLRQGILAPRLYMHYIFADAGCGCSHDAPLVAIEVNSREVIYAWPKST